jgi:hypothetical protein
MANHPDGWMLYHRSTKVDSKGNTWVNLKLIHPERASGKANFWLAYSPTRGDFFLSRDMRTMDVNYPELLPWVANKTTDWVMNEEQRVLELLG